MTFAHFFVFYEVAVHRQVTVVNDILISGQLDQLGPSQKIFKKKSTL